MTGLNAHVVHLYPRWVLSRGNGAFICIYRQPLGLFDPFLLQSLFTLRTPKHQTSLSLVRWLVRYSIWLLKNYGSRRGRLGTGPVTGTFQTALISAYQSWTWNLPGRATCPGSMQEPYHFWPQITPSGIIIRRYSVYTEIRRLYGVYTSYNTYQFLIRKIRYVDTLPPPVLYVGIGV